MQQNATEYLGGTRIQLVFRDREASYSLSGDVTLENIAATLGAISKRCIERPVAVYVTMQRLDC